MTRTVIIGASHAGLACAEKLRAAEYDGAITLVEREAGLPIQRPPLSKAYLQAESSDEAGFALRRPEFFQTLDIELRDGLAVTEIDRNAKQITLADGSALAYDWLVLATGAMPRQLPLDGAGAGGVHLLRTAADARALRGALGQAKKAVVAGGGYIGLEAAASLRKAGLEVTVIEMAERLLARVASPLISDYFADLHRQHGVQLVLGHGLSGLIGKAGRISGIELDDGRQLACDLLLAGIGVIPESELAEAAGLKVGNGIPVSADYRTEDVSIFAIGDVAHAAAHYPLRLESVHHAQFSGQVAAAAIVGQPLPETELPWFWSDQYDVKLQIAGLLPAADTAGLDYISRAGRRPGSLSVWSFVGEQLCSVESASDPQAYMIAKACMEKGQPVAKQDIANPEFDLKSLRSPAPA
ncbi:MAG: oxidoreductase [Alphaproteobacteria bacterium]|nr:oxidoreductase [Alphaproteobacteria bacterium]